MMEKYFKIGPKLLRFPEDDYCATRWKQPIVNVCPQEEEEVEKWIWGNQPFIRVYENVANLSACWDNDWNVTDRQSSVQYVLLLPLPSHLSSANSSHIIL